MERRGESKDFTSSNPLFIDSLTSLYNRYFLYNIFPKLKVKAKSSGTELAVFMMDIDNFKYINDTQGHLRGDSVIKEVGRIIKECVRGDDVVIRYAGDEYVILCQGTNHQLVKLIGNRIIESVGRNVFRKPPAPDLYVTISAGFSIYPRDGTELELLLDFADKALYLSKDRGKNRLSDSDEVTLGVVTYKETMKTLSLPKFINRFSELTRLREIWDNTLSSKIFFMLIKGKPGVGKTRLLDEFMRNLSSEGIEVLKVSCSPRCTPQPYQVLSKAIEEYLERTSKDLRFYSLASKEEISALLELIPSLEAFIRSRVLSEKTISGEPAKLGINLFNGLRRVLVDLSRQSGLLLYFDDIQWLDKATFELLKYFLTIESNHKIMLAATFCEDELTDEQLPCRDFLSLQSDNLSLLDLSPFSLEQTQEFIISIFPDINALSKLAKSIYDITKGNCLFMQEMLKCLVEDGKILYKDNQWRLIEPERLDIPSSLEEIIKRRLKRIDPETKEMLVQAAVMGKDVNLDTLRQIIAKNQGQLFEFIDRARDKGVFTLEDKIGDVNFMNDFMQKAIYGEIEAAQKTDLHRKTEEAISNLHRDNLKGVMGDLIYHAKKSGNESRANEYRSQLLETSLNLFNHQEIVDYLEKLGREITSKETAPSEVGIERIETEISEEILVKVMDLMRVFSHALQNISLYPPMNRARQESIRKVYEQTQEILKVIPSLTVSELERILLVNGRRLPHRLEKEFTDFFVTLILERDIKAIQFTPQIEEREVNAFLTVLAEEPDELRKKGGLSQVLTQEKISHIKIVTVDYGRLTNKDIGHPARGHLDNAMLFDFLLGKSRGEKIPDTNFFANKLKNAPAELAKDFSEAAREVAKHGGLKTTDIYPQAKIIGEGIEKLSKEILPGGWQAHRQDLVKLFLSLEKSVQTELISMVSRGQEKGMGIIRDIVASLSDNEIVNIITSGYTKDKKSLLNMKDLYNKLVLQPQRQEKVNPLLEKRLKSMGSDETEISFTMQKDYKIMSLQEKIDTLLKLSVELYPSIGRDNIKELIAELISMQNKDDLQEITTHILEQLEKASSKAREVIYQVLSDFITLVSSASCEFDATVLEVFMLFGRRLQSEEANLYPLLLKDIEMAINWIVSSVRSPELERWVMRERFMSLANLIFALYKRLEAKEESAQIQQQKGLLKDLVSRLSNSGLIEILIQQLKDPSLEYASLIEETVLKFGVSSLGGLITMITQNADFSFEGYLYRRRIHNILLKMGAPSIEKIKDYISVEKDPVKLRLLVEVIGYGKSPESVDLLGLLVKHNDPEVRKEVVISLSNIADSRSIDLLSEMRGDIAPEIAHLAKMKLAILKTTPKPET